MIDRDPWDPIPPATPERLKTADMCEDITARLLTSQRDDPPLYPQLVQQTLRALKQAADDVGALSVCELSVWARWVLEQLHHRAISGISYDDEEPAWSLDSERRMPR